MKVKEKLSSVSRGLERKDFFVSTMVCGMSSLLIQVTVVPGVTVTCWGLNVKFSTVIVTACSPASAGLAEKRKATTPSPANPLKEDRSDPTRKACGFLNFEVIDMKKFPA